MNRHTKTSFKLAPMLLAVQLAWAPALTSTVAHAEAAATTSQYDIPAGSLASALTRFAQQSGVAISVDANEIKGLSSPGLKGAYSLDEGFNHILAGTGYTAQKTTSGYALRKISAVREDGSHNALPEVSVTASMARESRAISEGTRSYAARAVTIGKGEQSLRETPQSVTVMTRQRMDDQSLTSLDSVLMQTTGVTRQFRNFGHSVYYSRGFAIGNYMADGVPMGDYGGIGTAPDTAILDRVEIMRGAPGLLIGNGDPGGTVNMVRKRPLAEKQIQVIARAGSWDYYRLDGDITGSLNESGSLRGRLVAGYEDRHYFYDEAQSKLPLLYGIIEADLGENTVAAAGFRYQHYKQNGGRWVGGLPLSNDGSDLKLSRSTSLGPGWTSYENEVKEIFGDVTHHFNDDWKLKVSTAHQRFTRTDAAMQRTSYVDSQTGAISFTQMNFAENKFEKNVADIQLNGKFTVWGQEHEMFIGANWQQDKTPSMRSYIPRYIPNVSANIYNLDLSSLPRLYQGAYGPASSQESTTQGIYGNVRLQLVDSLKLILGGRVSWYEFENSSNTSYKQTREVTPYAALIWRINETWSAYGSYTDIFLPQSSSYTVAGNPLEPAIGSNYEAGIKGEFYGGRLNTSLALFRIDQDNRAMPDPRFPTNCPASPVGGGCSINGGKVRSEGIEAEINGEVIPNLQLSAGYTFNAAKYIKDRGNTGEATANEGSRLSNDHNPRHLLRTWATYKLPGEWDRFTIGGGFTLQSELSYMDQYAPAGVVERHQNAYSIWNAHASYRIDEHWTAALNINNIFDKRYYTDALRSQYGEPQSMMLTVRGNF
ncbi:TonB-dependent receptor [Methylobacillus arboreus]|uniref:TonB-dependent siderophore receptor n=1 Tax=Methylobacillus arboreus TaxID=755170 RepID=UPI001E47B028|nr:TonB-dependent receptor [Methylobacillus arboreus]MCB5190934.1 TonB-dependent receptor [Methylobacillus arboreus]